MKMEVFMMKKKNLSLILVIIMISTFVPIITHAAAPSGTCGDNLTWNIENNILTVSGSGSMKGYSSIASFPWYDYKSSFTKVVIEEGVTSVSNGAFSLYDNIVNIELPSTISEIPSASMYGDNLESINVDPNNMYYSSINGVLFNKDQTILLSYAGKSTTIYSVPNSVNAIGDNAFYYSKGIKNIIIPNSVESIGEFAFCRSTLTNIDIPDNVKTIGDSAFYDCDSLLRATIGDGVSVLPEYLFYGSDSLNRILIGKKITSINNNGFDLCGSLTSIEVDPLNSVFSSNNGVLFNNSKTKLILCPSGKSGKYVIPDGVVEIESYAFVNCKKITDVTIPDSTESIGDGAFSGCSSLSSVPVGKSITNIAKYTFSFCTGLTNVTIPNNISIIGEEAFSHCSNLTDITIPDSIDSIGFAAFYYCSDLLNVFYNGNIEEWNNITIEDMNTSLTNASIHYSHSVKEQHDIEIEVRDASTNEMISDARIALFSDAGNAEFYKLSDGKATLKEVGFPIYKIKAYADDYTYDKGYENVSYPETGKIVFLLSSFKSQEIPVQGVYIFDRIDELNVGETHRLEGYVSPITATDKNITWSSNNDSVAAVSNDGVVTARSNGTVTITAESSNGKTASCQIAIKNESYITSFNKIAYSFSNNAASKDKIPLKIYQYVFGEEEGTIEYKNDKTKGTNGVCAGMVSTSLMFYNQYRNYIDYGAANIRGLKIKNDKLKNFIRYMYLSQNQSVFLNEKANNGIYHNPSYNTDNSAAVKELVNMAANNLLYISVGNNSGGHALLSYGITISSTYDSKPCSKLWIYDCNFPNDYDNYIALYKSDDGSYNGQWEYVGNHYPYDSNQRNSRLSYNTYNTIIQAAEKGQIQLMSITDQTAKITVIQDSTDMSLTNEEQQNFICNDGLITKNDITDLIYHQNYYFDSGANRLSTPDGSYSVTGQNSDGEMNTTIYSSSDCISSLTSSDAQITFNVRDAANETQDGDNYININNNSVASDYSITYMPYASVYDYDYDEITVSGNSSNIINTYEQGGNIYVSGDDSFSVSASVGNETVSTAAENLDENTLYCIKVETINEKTTIQIFCDETAVSDKISLPERQQVLQPEYDLETGEYNISQTLTLTPSNEMMNLYYTTDGSEPEEDISMLYSEPIDINKSMTVKIMAAQYGCENSDVLTLNYVLPNVTIPIPSLLEGEYVGTQQVELIADEDANIYYTTDGSDPMENGELYTCPIVITNDTRITAYAEKDGCISDTVNYNYTVTEETASQEYSATFKNYDGSILQSNKVPEGELAQYINETPTRVSDDKYHYIFTGWSPEIVEIKEDTTYTAQFSPIAHTWDEGKVTIEATCIESGTRTYTCTECGQIKTELLKATGHSYGDWKITEEPTFIKGGKAVRSCLNNSAHTENVDLPVLTDTNIWTIGTRVEPTKDVDGYQEYISEYGTVKIVIPYEETISYSLEYINGNAVVTVPKAGTYMLIFAAYDECGTIVSVELQTLKYDTEGTQIFTAEYFNTANANTVKLMLWDSISTMRPLCHTTE